MNPFVMFLLAILSPFLLCMTLLVPIYAGVLGASYAIYYKPGKPHLLNGECFNIFYIVDTYTTLFNGWVAHMKEASLLTYTLPLLLLPLIGIFLAIWMTAKLARKLKDIFHIGVGM